MIQKLPAKALETIDRYLHLPLGNNLVQCPYFKNRQGIRAGERVKLGKGSVDEILVEFQEITHKENLSINNMSEQEIRALMEKYNLGSDCSGFISQILKSINPELVKQLAAKNFFKQPVRSLIAKLRPIENISVKVLTSSQKADKLSSWRNLQPGDIIRTRKGAHALIISEVRRLEAAELKEITYHHSTGYYGGEHGVREGKISILYPKEDLQDQSWEEIDNDGKNYTLDGFLDDDGSNGIYRIKELT